MAKVEVSAAGISDGDVFYPWATIAKVENNGWGGRQIRFNNGETREVKGLREALREYEERSKSGG